MAARFRDEIIALRSVFPHNGDTAIFRENAKVLFDAIERGYMKVDIGSEYRLDQIVEVDRSAGERRFSGAILMRR